MTEARFIESTQSYMGKAFHPMGDLATEFKQGMKDHGVKFDTLVGTGLSGSLVVPHLARRLKKNWAIVRKGNDGSHSSNPVEGRLGRRWIFVDDFVASGSTRQRVLDAVQVMVDAQHDEWRWSFGSKRTFSTTFLGTYEYEPAKFQPATQGQKTIRPAPVPDPEKPSLKCTCEDCQPNLTQKTATRQQPWTCGSPYCSICEPAAFQEELAAVKAPGGWSGVYGWGAAA